jgi:hypothetical protein
VKRRELTPEEIGEILRTGTIVSSERASGSSLSLGPFFDDREMLQKFIEALDGGMGVADALRRFGPELPKGISEGKKRLTKIRK